MAPVFRTIDDVARWAAQLEDRLRGTDDAARQGAVLARAFAGQPAPPTTLLSLPHNDTYANQDNVDATHALNLDYVIPSNAQRVVSARLSFKLRPFRSYDVGIPSATTAAGPHVHYWHAPGSTAAVTTNQLFATAGGALETGPGPGGGTPSVPAGKQTSTEHAVGSAQASIDTAIEAFDANGHTHTVTPSLTYGVFEGATATGVKVLFDGVDQTSALGGPFNADVVELDVLSFIASQPGGGWHTISLLPTGLGRIQAYLRLGAYVNGSIR